jgi:hypothetical protein
MRARRLCPAAGVPPGVSPGVVMAIAALREIGRLSGQVQPETRPLAKDVRAIARLVQSGAISGHGARELDAGCHAGLPEHLPQVVVDGGGAQEQLRGDARVRASS